MGKRHAGDGDQPEKAQFHIGKDRADQTRQERDRGLGFVDLPGSVLTLLWRDLCLFMYHYFGH